MKTESRAQRAERRTEEIMRARHPNEHRLTIQQQLGLLERTPSEIEASRREQSILEQQLP